MPNTTQLRRIRQDVGLSVELMAERTGLKIETLRKLEAGGREPLLTTALLLARALGVLVEDLFQDA